LCRTGSGRCTNLTTFSDLRDELAQWRDEERFQRTIDEAHLAAIKLRAWTGEKGVYSRLFDRHTTLRLDNNWLFFNVEGLSDDSRLETAMSMLIANAMAERSSHKLGSPALSYWTNVGSCSTPKSWHQEVVQLFRTARKRFSSVCGISQTPEDFVGTPQQPRLHGPGIIKNATTKIIGQQPGDMTALVNHLHLNEVALNQIKHFSAPHKGQSADVLLVLGEKAETTQTIRMVPTPVDYWVCTTFARERAYRNWFLKKSGHRPLLESYLDRSSFLFLALKWSRGEGLVDFG
jgi:hypothetical protein